MMEISCDACEKKYRIDETKMKRRRAKVKCKACGYIMVITKPESESPSDPSLATDVFEPSPPSDDTRPSIPPTPAVPASSVDQPPGPEREEAAAEERDMSPFVSTQKIRFGLFGKINRHL